jgi:hypothetical protein
MRGEANASRDRGEANTSCDRLEVSQTSTTRGFPVGTLGCFSPCRPPTREAIEARVDGLVSHRTPAADTSRLGAESTAHGHARQLAVLEAALSPSRARSRAGLPGVPITSALDDAQPGISPTQWQFDRSRAVFRPRPVAAAAAAEPSAREVAPAATANPAPAAHAGTGGFTDSRVAKLHQKLNSAAYNQGGKDFVKLFRHYDRDNSGELGLEEFCRCVRKDVKLTLNMMSDDEVRELFEAVDTSGDNTIDEKEFVALLTGAELKPRTHGALHFDVADTVRSAEQPTDAEESLCAELATATQLAAVECWRLAQSLHWSFGGCSCILCQTTGAESLPVGAAPRWAGRAHGSGGGSWDW